MQYLRQDIRVQTESVEHTHEFGRDFAATLQSGDVVVLQGALGAGKTCFVKGIAEGLGYPAANVTSPSYTLVNEYQARVAIYHFDLYRLKDASELYGIGWDDYLMRDGIVMVEWGERAGEFLPKSRIEITIDIISDTSRAFMIRFID